MKVLFLDCFSGIAGDMTVGALVDLGVKPSALEWELSKLEIGDFHMHFERQQRQNVEGIKFGIHAGATHQHPGEHEHEHAHEHGEGHHHHHHHGDEEHEHGHSHSHPEEELEPDLPHHAHDQDHGSEVSLQDSEEEHVHGLSHRKIRDLLNQSELSPFVKAHALSIFARIADAEGKIHGMPPEDVEFHEVGALDSIADIVCACVGIEALGVEKIFVSSLVEGRGTIRCAHGTFPVPAPATLEILKGIPLEQVDERHELITPTGAAIVAEFGQAFGSMPKLKVEKIGYGVGTRELASRPNVLRAVLGELVEG